MPILQPASPRPSQIRLASITAILASTLVATLLSGCAITNPVSEVATANVVLAGKVHGGNQPVVGSTISLFATSAAGYGAPLTPLATTTTNSTGGFNISTAYTCPAGSQAYIVAAGGNPGLQAGTDNSAILLMAALGPCSALSASTTIWLNEVTTVAAAYALSGFAPPNNTLTEAAVVRGTNVPGFATSTSNVQGLIDAFANANNIVNFNTGQAYSVTPTASANGTVPTPIINALADILQDCVNSSGPGSAQCINLFAAATPPSGSGIAAPVNVLQAAIDIAQYPANNVSTLFNLISPQAAFPATGLTAAPNDWSIGIAYTNSLLSTALGMAIDANDNVYVSGSTNANLIEFNAQGNVLSPGIISPATQGGWIPTVKASSHNIRNIAFDQTGSLWLSDGAAAGLYQYTPGGTSTSPTTGTLTQQLYSVAPASVATANNYAVAVDGLGDVYTTGYKKSTCTTSGTTACALVEFVKGAATPYTPFSSFGSLSGAYSPGLGGARGVAYDVNTNNIWYTDIVENAVSVVSLTPSATTAASVNNGSTVVRLGTEAANPSTNTYGAVSVAIDKSSTAWVVVAGGPATTGATATSAISPAIYPISSTWNLGTAVTGGGLSSPAYIAVDGNNNLFIANTGTFSLGNPGDTTNAGTIVEYSPGFNSNTGAFLSGTYGLSPSATVNGGVNGLIFQPSYVAIDRAGALWTMSPGSGTPTVTSGATTNLQTANLVQILGVAAPVNPIQAAGQYGIKP